MDVSCGIQKGVLTAMHVIAMFFVFTDNSLSRRQFPINTFGGFGTVKASAGVATNDARA